MPPKKSKKSKNPFSPIHAAQPPDPKSRPYTLSPTGRDEAMNPDDVGYPVLPPVEADKTARFKAKSRPRG